MTNEVPPEPLVTYRGVVHFGIFRPRKSCKSPTVLRVVRAGFAKSYAFLKKRGSDGLTFCFFLFHDRISGLLKIFLMKNCLTCIVYSCNILSEVSLF